jgi:hypothetical protein
MGINKAIEAIAFVCVLAAATGQLPRMLRQVQIAQLHLLKASQSQSWGQALLLPTSK